MKKYEAPTAKEITFLATDVIAASWDLLTVWGSLVDTVDAEANDVLEAETKVLWE